MVKSRAFVPALLGLVLMGALALALASQALERGAAPGVGETPEGQGYPPPATRPAVDAQGYPPPGAPTAVVWTPDPNYTDEFLLPPPTNTAVPALPESFDPQTYGLPETIAGYPVLAVLAPDNRACMPPDWRMVVLESPYASMSEMLTAHPWPSPPGSPEQTAQVTATEFVVDQVYSRARENVPAALAALGLDPSDWHWTFGEPGDTREQAIERARDWNDYAQQNGCLTHVPIATEVVTVRP